MRVLLIIPAFNEGKNIKNLINRIHSVCATELDILVINDCSLDDTKSVCDKINVPIINLPCNLGIGGAVQTGYKYAYQHDYDIAIQIDGDGQHRPEYVRSLIQFIIEDKADMVIGSRFLNKEGFQSTVMRRLGIAYFTHLIKFLSKQKLTDPTSGFRACNKRIIGLFAKRYPVDYPEPESIMYLLRNHYRIMEIPVVMQERIEGSSSITVLKSVYYMIKVSLAILIDRFRKQII